METNRSRLRGWGRDDRFPDRGLCTDRYTRGAFRSRENHWPHRTASPATSPYRLHPRWWQAAPSAGDTL